jgi:hypothetical protein
MAENSLLVKPPEPQQLPPPTPISIGVLGPIVAKLGIIRPLEQSAGATSEHALDGVNEMDAHSHVVASCAFDRVSGHTLALVLFAFTKFTGLEVNTESEEPTSISASPLIVTSVSRPGSRGINSCIS